MSKNYKYKKSGFMTELVSSAIVSILIFSLTGLYGMPVSAQAVENPQDGSVGLEGQIPGPPPDQAATINSPVNGQTFTDLPITISGTCPAGVIVEIYRNDVFAGSAVCSDNGTFRLQIDLFNGENRLMAKVRDTLGQLGPDSRVVTVFFDPAVTRSDRQLSSQQLMLLTGISFRGAEPDSKSSFPIRLVGGRGPYAISITWGDGSSDVKSRSDTGNFSIGHTYDSPGVYRIIVKATDELGSVAFLQLTAIIDGVSGTNESEQPPPRVIREVLLWPLFVLLAMIPIAYWLGMRHERRKYR